MKFTVDSKIIAKALNACSKVSRFSTYNPVFSMIRVTVRKPDSIKLEASDGHVNITYFLTADVEEEGVALVDCKRFASFVSARAGTVRAHSTKVRLIVNNAGGKLWLQFYTGTTLFPEPPDMPLEAPIKLDGETVRDLMGVAFMCGKEGGSFDGLYVAIEDGILKTVATNGFNAGYAWTSVDWDGRISFILPQYIAAALPGFVYNDDELKLYVTKKHLIFLSDEFIFSTAGLNQPFPYDALMRLMEFDTECEIEVDVAELADIINMASIIADSTDSSLHRLHFDSDGLRHSLTISTPEGSQIGGMEQHINTLDHKGGDMHFVLNPAFISGLVKALEKIQRSSLFSVKDLKKKITIGKSVDSKVYYFYSPYMNAKFGIAPLVS